MKKFKINAWIIIDETTGRPFQKTDYWLTDEMEIFFTEKDAKKFKTRMPGKIVRCEIVYAFKK